LSDCDAGAIAVALDVLAHDGAVTPARVRYLRQLLSTEPSVADGADETA